MSKASKGALRQRYMAKGAESHEDVPATEKRIDELLDKVIKDSNLKIKGRTGYGKGQEKRSEGGFQRPRTDMADIVKRAMALRQEVESAGTKDKSKAAKKTAKKPFPVKLETSSSDSHVSESESSSDNEDVSDTSIKNFDMPDLDSASESSEDDTDKLERYRKRSKPKFDFKQTSVDLTDVDDVMAMEEAKRKLGKKPDLWSSKPPGYKKFEQKKDENKTSENDSKTKPKLIETFPPEVEALRTKLALGDFGMSNRDFLNSDKFLNSKKEIQSKSKTGPNTAIKDSPQNGLTSRTKETPTFRAESNVSKKILTTVGGRKGDTAQDSVKKTAEKNRNAERTTKLVDLNKRRPSVGSGRTASKLI